MDPPPSKDVEIRMVINDGEEGEIDNSIYFSGAFDEVKLIVH